MKLKFIFLIAFITSVQSYGGVSAVGTTAAPFLEIEIGSRAIGMGGAFVAVADDANAIYWNPSGLARLEKNEVTFTHIEWLADINFDFVGSIFYLGNYGAIGMSLTSLSTADMMVRTIEEPEGNGEMFSFGSIALGLSYARALTDRFSMGFNAKYIQEKIWHMTASSFAIDFGTLFITHFNDLRIGMSITNFGMDMMLSGRDVIVYHDIDETIIGNNELITANLTTDKWPLPLTYRAGLAMDILSSKKNHLTIAIDAVHPNNNTEYLNMGMELGLNNMLFLRGGYSSLFKRNSEEGLTLGTGVRSGIGGTIAFRFDYAFAVFNRLGNTHRISMGMDF
ncbi:PorV/PorQ family protein [candidate division WOR-3 bacterium]|nr:PorV/PorQ family protein [candidate division WOR-3 bacterium]